MSRASYLAIMKQFSAIGGKNKKIEMDVFLFLRIMTKLINYDKKGTLF